MKAKKKPISGDHDVFFYGDFNVSVFVVCRRKNFKFHFRHPQHRNPSDVY